MKISVVHNFYDRTAPSGEDAIVDAEVGALLRRGHEVQLVGGGSAQSQIQGFYDLARTAFRVASGVGKSPLTEILKFGPDIVHIHNLFPGLGENWLAELAIPYVVTLHNFRYFCAAGTFNREGRPCFRCLDFGQFEAVRYGCYRRSKIATVPLAIRNSLGVNRPVLSGAKTIVALSRRSKSLLESAGVEANKIEVVNNFWPGEPFESRQLVAAEERSGWVYAGRLSAEKGFARLMEVWPESEQLVVFGAGPLEDLALRCHQEGKIDFRGFVPPEAVFARLLGAEGLIFPSLLVENSPVVYAQALVAGAPTLALPGNSVSDDISEYSTGVVMKSLDELPNAIQALRNQEGFYSRAHRRGISAFSEHSWVDQMEHLFETAVSGSV